MKNKKLVIGIILVSFAYGTRFGIRFSYLPQLIDIYTNSAFLITLLLSLGTFIGIFLSPLIGKRNDRTWTRFGRRRPYLMVSIPLVSLFTVLIPHSSSYTGLLVFVILEAISGIIGFSPLFSLIPDNFEPADRGKMNGIFILFIGLGGAFASAVGYKLWDINYHFIFYLMASCIFVFGVLSLFFIKEKPFPDNMISNKSQSIIAYFKDVLHDKRITLYYASDFFRWFSKSLIIQMVALFAVKELGVNGGVAAQTLLVFNLIKLLSSFPVGFATDKINRKHFLLIGTALMGGALYYGWCAQSIVSLFVAMGLFGISTTITIICGSAFLMDLFPTGKAGEFLGMNMVFGSIPTVIALWVSGALIDIFGTYRLIFMVGTIGIVISFIFTILIPSQKKAVAQTNPGNL